MFASFGPVTDVNLVTDRTSGRSRGFAFVTMATADGAHAAMKDLAGKNIKGRNLTVNEARAREEKSGGGRSFGDRPHSGGGERQQARW